MKKEKDWSDVKFRLDVATCALRELRSAARDRRDVVTTCDTALEALLGLRKTFGAPKDKLVEIRPASNPTMFDVQ